MNILVLLSRFPYPTEKGDKLRAFYQLKDLSTHNKIHLLCFSEEKIKPENRKKVESLCESVTIIPLNWIRKLFSLFLGIFNRKPFQVNYFFHPGYKEDISKITKTQKIEIIYMQLVRLGKNLPKNLKTPIFLDFMDAFSAGMEKRSKTEKFLVKIAAKVEAKRLRNYESKMLERLHGFSIISEADAKAIQNPTNKEISIIPNGVKEFFFEKIDSKKEFDIIFTGNMSYFPNVQAAKFLVEEILPLLYSIYPELKICLAGASPNKEVLALKSKNVEVTGFVEDIRVYLAKSKLFVAPLFYGSGLQNKLLESMAAKLPTICTTHNNSALKAKEDVDLLIANNAEQFVEKIIYLLENAKNAEKLAKNGQKFIQKNYVWEHFNYILNEKLIETKTNYES